METCIFCKIISKKEDAFIIYEDDYVCCFLDKHPINKGHILVVPKKHYQEFSEVDKDSLTQVILASQKLSTVLEKILNTDGITIMQSNGIFKDVEHYHMHIIPRFLNDGFSWLEPEIEVTKEEFILLSAKKSNFKMQWLGEDTLYILNDDSDYPNSNRSIELEIGQEIYHESGLACKSLLMKNEYVTCYQN